MGHLSLFPINVTLPPLSGYYIAPKLLEVKFSRMKIKLKNIINTIFKVHIYYPNFLLYV